MKKTLIILICFIAFAKSLLANEETMPCPVFLINVPGQTKVLLKIAEQLNSAKLTVGRTIKCEVIADVKIQNEIVIKTGAIAIARIKALENQGSYNNPEIMTIEITSVQAVDGTMIDLNATDAVFEASNTDEAITVDAGILIEARTMNEVVIRVKE